MRRRRGEGFSSRRLIAGRLVGPGPRLRQCGVEELEPAARRVSLNDGHDVVLPAQFAPEDQALLTDPQTSGGLLVACAPQAVDAVRAIFTRHGFGAAAVVGRCVAAPQARLVVG